MQTSRSGRSQGWGLVEFASAAEVEYGAASYLCRIDAIEAPPVCRKSRPDGVLAHRYAISQCDGLDLDGREIRVRADKGSGTGVTGQTRVDAAKEAMPKKTRRHVADKVVDPHRIFVMNLNFDTTEDELADHCASYGSVVAAELLTRGRNNRPSGSAIVEYSADHEAKAAIAGLEGQELGGRPLRVREYYSA